ncbi:organic solute transporter Ostalpha-domain-containing protein [Sporodiniella umbellata]|nr:organic solute transporter Ostalpha-domain-containing protein [Sporodiniella umbellata]
MLHSRPPSENFFPGTLYSREIFVGDPYTFLFVKRGILQFVYVKPILAVITMALKATNHYREGDFGFTSSYFWITFVYNLSVSFCLWCLMVFFYATKKDLVSFRPLPKFLCVKAIIFFSFWQSVVVAILVSAGVIPEAEHISVAIQDFLVCIEMVPFAIAHSFSFSYEDYFDTSVHSARVPIRIAIQDSLGLKDVYMDTLLTLRGSGFSYRSFEPSEGVAHIGSSRNSRIMAGLRYSNMTSKKHWIGPAPTSKYLPTGPGEAVHEDEDSEPLTFEDPTEDMEVLFKDSRRMEFGDYNYPVIDFREPLWRQAQRPTYGTTNGSEVMRRLGHPREGCIDVVIEQGKGKYVLVDDLLKEQEQEEQRLKVAPPSIHAKKKKLIKDPPIQKPSLSTPNHSFRYPQPQASVSTPQKQPEKQYQETLQRKRSLNNDPIPQHLTSHQEPTPSTYTSQEPVPSISISHVPAEHSSELQGYQNPTYSEPNAWSRGSPLYTNEEEDLLANVWQ